MVVVVMVVVAMVGGLGTTGRTVVELEYNCDGRRKFYRRQMHKGGNDGWRGEDADNCEGYKAGGGGDDLRRLTLEELYGVATRCW